MAISLDNASNNYTTVIELAILLNLLEGDDIQGHCFNHILNLSAKAAVAFIKQRISRVMVAASSDDLSSDDNDSGSESDPGTSDSEDDDSPTLFTLDDEPESLTTTAAGRSAPSVAVCLNKVCCALYYGARLCSIAVTQIRHVSEATHRSSTSLRPAWETTLKNLNLPFRKIPRDVATRWNSSFTLILFALEYRPAFDSMTKNNPALFADALSVAEWEILAELKNLLKVIVFILCVSVSKESSNYFFTSRTRSSRNSSRSPTTQPSAMSSVYFASLTIISSSSTTTPATTISSRQRNLRGAS